MLFFVVSSFRPAGSIVGYSGCVVDSSNYVYFIPNRDDSDFHSRAVRVHSSEFLNASNWIVYE